VQTSSTLVADHLLECGTTNLLAYQNKFIWICSKCLYGTISEVIARFQKYGAPTASVLSYTGYSKAPGIFMLSDCQGWANLSASKIAWQCPLFFSLWGSGKDQVCRTPIQETLILFARITHSINMWRQTDHTLRQKIDIDWNFCVLSEHRVSQDTDRKLYLIPESTECTKPHNFFFSKLADVRFCDRKHKLRTCLQYALWK
jgi:hypothetical protein